MPVRAVIFDFGGVILSSPFEAFARYEADNGLPPGLIRRLNASDPDTNAWARLERSEVDLAGFVELFEAEARAAGHVVDGREVLGLLAGQLRPRMVEALRRCHDRLKTALLTNNFVAAAPDEVGAGAAEAGRRAGPMGEVLDHFDVIVESSRVALRKPDPAIYRLVCDELGVAPAEAVFLDDLGVNLKPARAMGMTTIKVIDPDRAIAELAQVVGFPLA
ncbi:MAG TPA: HAD-IA family hydrolase [Acidimicrobiales bacterium]|nr:HAD-IA family hydrolase [Acidimicrobiales bacterium]